MSKTHEWWAIRARQAKRAAAIDRRELALPTAPRIAAAGPHSMAIKVVDIGTRALIDEALAARARAGEP